MAIVYHQSDASAEATKNMVQKEGRRCELVRGDVREERFCQRAVEETMEKFGTINILVNNAAQQHVREAFEDVSMEQMEDTFRTNVFGYFYFAHYVVPHMKEGDCIINTTSVTAYRGSKHLVDYSSTKGAIVSLTRSLSSNLIGRGIRVNGVAPGPIWTPFIPKTFPADKLEDFGENTPIGRCGQPSEVAPAFVFLASKDASYITGQVMHVNGGEIVE